jgi:predicted Zn finger-like uncharacterized protein
MILQCPTCQARFLINDALVPAEGRTVRCGACKHSWLATPNPVPIEGVTPAKPANFAEALAVAEAEQAAAPQAEAAPAPASIPAAPKAKLRLRPFIAATAALAASVLIAAPLAYYPELKHSGAVNWLYDTLGWSVTDGLAFAEVAMVREMHNGKTRFVLSGNVTNNAEVPRRLPSVRVTLKNREGEVMWSRHYDVDRTVKPDEVYPFRIVNVETTFGDSVSMIVMDLGNQYELMMR